MYRVEMKVLLLGSLCICLLMLAVSLLSNYLSAEYGEGRVIQRAIEAHGGAEGIRRIKAGHLKGDGMRHRLHGDEPFTWEEWFEVPDRYKLMMRDSRSVAYYLAPPRKWWIGEGDQKPAIKDLGEVHATSQFEPIRRLVEIQRQKLPVVSLGEQEVGFIPAVALQVDSEQWGQVAMSFDKSKGLLIQNRGQVAQSGRASSFTNRQVFSRHQDVQGVLLPMKITVFVNDQPHTEMTIRQAEFVDKLDPSVFAPP
jgi:hypothetical protein